MDAYLPYYTMALHYIYYITFYITLRYATLLYITFHYMYVYMYIQYI